MKKDEFDFDYRDSLKNFAPLNEEEQKLLLFLCLNSLEELKEKYSTIRKNEKTRKAFIDGEMRTYDFISQVFTRSEWEDEIGIKQHKDFILNIAKKQLDEYLGSKDKGC